MQFSTSSISVRTPERMQFGKRADHQPLRSTVKRTLKCGAGSFRPTLSTLLFVPKRARNGDGAGPYAPDVRLASSGLGSAWCEPSTVPHRLPFRRSYCTMWLRSNAPAVRAGRLSWSEIQSPTVSQGQRTVSPAARISNARAARALAALRGVASRRFSRWRAEHWWAPKVRTKSAENLARCGRNAVASCCPGYAL